ncbi:MAG: OmpA family protein [Gemmatimonadaceae bacterium]
MLSKALIFAVTTLVWALPAAAQERGTIEFGAFGSAASFDNDLSLKTGYGGGGRVGAFLDPRLSIEFEDAEMRASRPNGLRNVNVGIVSGRLVGVPIRTGALSIILGAGAGVSTETNFMHSYGVDGLVGAKLALNDHVALRIDGVMDWLANQNWKTYRSVRAGISVYRHPATRLQMVTVVAPAPVMIAHEDSVSAAETSRLRDRDAALRALRDSLADAPVARSAANVATMEATIHFAFDKSALTDSAKAILDDKIQVFRASPTMNIGIRGYTDLIGTNAYNMALGTRRANAAKAYIVARGIDASRVTIESAGESQPITRDEGIVAQAPNRRAIFRLLIDAGVRRGM